jgi:hypothetical protein
VEEFGRTNVELEEERTKKQTPSASNSCDKGNVFSSLLCSTAKSRRSAAALIPPPHYAFRFSLSPLLRQSSPNQSSKKQMP